MNPNAVKSAYERKGKIAKLELSTSLVFLLPVCTRV